MSNINQTPVTDPADTLAGQADVPVDQDAVITAQVLAGIPPETAARLHEQMEDGLQDTIVRALAQDGDAVRTLLQSGMDARQLASLLASINEITDQETVNALVDHQVTIPELIEEFQVPVFVLIQAANRDEQLYDQLLDKDLRLDVKQLLMARANPDKLVRHLTVLRPDMVRSLISYGVDLHLLEAQIDQLDAANNEQGYAHNYYRNHFQSLLNEARAERALEKQARGGGRDADTTGLDTQTDSVTPSRE